jgi:hypothetical protein
MIPPQMILPGMIPQMMMPAQAMMMPPMGYPNMMMARPPYPAMYSTAQPNSINLLADQFG